MSFIANLSLCHLGDLIWVTLNSFSWTYLSLWITEVAKSVSRLSIVILTSVHLIISISTPISVATPPDYRANTEVAFTTLQKWYNISTGTWDTTGWWNSANCLTVLGDLAAVDLKIEPKVTIVFNNSWTQGQNYNLQMTKVIRPDFLVETFYGPFFPAGISPIPIINPQGFLNDYYDDEGWWALGWIQAYDVTKDTKYLKTAANIFEDMKNGSTTPCGGGIWWDKAHTYVNAIANGLYLSVASHLANRMSNKEYYLDIALQQWEWLQNTGMINSQNLLNDGLSTNCTNNNGTVWSYNQGVILGGLVELNTASPNQTYIRTAKNVASAAIKALSDAAGVLHDSCEPNCGADGTQFKGVFVRNLQKLQHAAPDNTFLRFIAINAATIWAYDRNPANELSVVWTGPFVAPANASTQSSALDALVAATTFF